MAKGIKLIEVRSELGAGTRGASLGIDALKLASLEYGSYYFGKFKSKEVKDASLLLYKNPIRTYAKRIRGVIRVFNKLAAAVSKEIRTGGFPVVISGDHSSAGGTIAGIKMAYPDKKLGVIWIDAHADLHSPYTTPSGNIHGMPLAAALGIDNLDNSTNEVTGDTVPYWEILKNIGNVHPKITPDSLVYIAVRDTEAPERDYIRKNKIKVVKVQEVRKGKIKELCKSVLDHLGTCDILYVSFDIDSLDAKLVKGTGTPVDGGLTINEATKMLEIFLKDPRMACFEITEINPLLDDENQTAKRVFPIFREAVNTIEKQKKKQQKELKKVIRAAGDAVPAAAPKPAGRTGIAPRTAVASLRGIAAKKTKPKAKVKKPNLKKVVNKTTLKPVLKSIAGSKPKKAKAKNRPKAAKAKVTGAAAAVMLKKPRTPRIVKKTVKRPAGTKKTGQKK